MAASRPFSVRTSSATRLLPRLILYTLAPACRDDPPSSGLADSTTGTRRESGPACRRRSAAGDGNRWVQFARSLRRGDTHTFGPCGGERAKRRRRDQRSDGAVDLPQFSDPLDPNAMWGEQQRAPPVARARTEVVLRRADDVARRATRDDRRSSSPRTARRGDDGGTSSHTTSISPARYANEI